MPKDVAVAKSHGLALSDEAAVELMSGGDDFEKGDLQVPFLKLVQKLSPYMKESNEKYNPDAKEGHIVETVMGNLFPSSHKNEEPGILVIPVAFERNYAEWLPNRGGLVQSYGTDPSILEACERNDKGGYVRKDNGNEISEVAFYYSLFYAELMGFWDQAVIPMGGTQWSKARNWNTQMRKLLVTKPTGERIPNPAMFAGCYRLTAVREIRDDNEFMGWVVKFHDFTLNLNDGESLIKMAVSFRNLVKEGKVKTVDDDELAGEESDAPDDGFGDF